MNKPSTRLAIFFPKNHLLQAVFQETVHGVTFEIQHVDLHWKFTQKEKFFFFFFSIQNLFNNKVGSRVKIWNASWICVSSLRRGHANLLWIVPILVYVLPKRARKNSSLRCHSIFLFFKLIVLIVSAIFRNMYQHLFYPLTLKSYTHKFAF